MKTQKSSLKQRFSEPLSRISTWLIPGIGVKRWLILIFLGITMLAVGVGFVLLDIYHSADVPWWANILAVLALRFLPRWARIVIFVSLGLGTLAFGIWELNRSLIRPFMRPGDRLTDALREHRQKERGPRIVAIGGGHGLATLLRGLKEYSKNITAIVTVADDGGSSGRLRREVGILPPGDIRNCLAALANDEALLGQLFQYRFPEGDAGLDGHTFGNLFITAMAEVTGSFEEAVAESGRVLAVHGRVLPSTLHDVYLSADVMLPQAVMEVRVQGESQIPKSNGKVRHVWLEPNNPPAYPESIQAILAADLIVIGPGSLYTSILPNLLVPDLVEAVRASRALKIMVCNVATQRGETDGYTCGDHLRVVEEHVGKGVFNLAVVNQVSQENAPPARLSDGVEWVRIEDDLEEDYAIYRADLTDELYPWRHDSRKLARVIIDLLQEKTGPLVE